MVMNYDWLKRSDTVKAILVLNEMPKNCLECPLGKNMSIAIETCIQCPIGKCAIDAETEIRPDWCPLKPMPNKNTKQYSDGYKYGKGYQNGYNACIDEILGDKG